MFFPGGATQTPQRPAAAAADGDARTRDAVLQAVSELGPVSASRVAEELGLTSAGVRRHLEQLDTDGLIATSEAAPARRGRGRPARAYVVTPAGHTRLSSRYDDVATSALEFLAERCGEHAVADFARERLSEVERRYAPIVAAAGDDVEARAEALAAALARDGYAASARPVGPEATGLQLCQGHCPMHAVAARFPQFCEEEADVFARLLGVRVQRLATLAGGEHVCTTFVPHGPAPLPIPARRSTAPDDHDPQPDHRHHRHHEGSAR